MAGPVRCVPYRGGSGCRRGTRISGELALIGAVVAEFVAGAGAGLVWRIVEPANRLNIPRAFAALLLMSMPTAQVARERGRSRELRWRRRSPQNRPVPARRYRRADITGTAAELPRPPRNSAALYGHRRRLDRPDRHSDGSSWLRLSQHHSLAHSIP
jgi:hypothetical protein